MPEWLDLALRYAPGFVAWGVVVEGGLNVAIGLLPRVQGDGHPRE